MFEIKAGALLSLSNDDAAAIAMTIPYPAWLVAKKPRFEMRDDELCAVWNGGRAVWTGEAWEVA